MKKFSKEIQIALVAVAALLVLFFGLKFLKGMTLFSSDNRYFVKFKDVSGLSMSSPIFANGYRVGVVEDIVFDYANTGEIVATIGIDPKLSVPAGSRAEIASDLMGNVKVELVLGDAAQGMVAPGDTITGCQPVDVLVTIKDDGQLTTVRLGYNTRFAIGSCSLHADSCQQGYQHAKNQSFHHDYSLSSPAKLRTFTEQAKKRARKFVLAQ